MMSPDKPEIPREDAPDKPELDVEVPEEEFDEEKMHVGPKHPETGEPLEQTEGSQPGGGEESGHS